MSKKYPDHVHELLASDYGLTGKITALPSEWGGTYHIHGEGEYLLKIAPDHVDQDRIALEKQILEFIQQDASIDWVPKLISRRNSVVDLDGRTGRVRLYSWIEGRPLRNVNPHSEQLLRSIGRHLATLKKGIVAFDHPAAYFHFDWAPHNWEWVKGYIQDFDSDNQILAQKWIEHLSLTLENLDASNIPFSINHGDANDDNIIIRDRDSGPEFSGFIDFGDVHYGPSVNDLAICLAYVMMGKKDPIESACHVIAGYKEVSTISERELKVLLSLSIARLLISVTKAKQRESIDPDNIYWQVSATPAWHLMKLLSQLSPQLILFHFRAACGLEPSPTASRLRQWLNASFAQLHPVLGFDLRDEGISVFDWSVGSTQLGDLTAISDVAEATHLVFKQLARDGTRVGVGRYDEPRPVYTTSEYAVVANDGLHMRTVHIGIDLFMPAGTPLYAPIDGVVFAIVNNAGDKEYGPLLILQHTVDTDLVFYTLYGHNSLQTLNMWSKGDHVAKGDKIAEIGSFPENGNWVPHVHFQIITDLLDFTDDYPGVVLPEHLPVWLSICPNPNLMLGMRHPDLTFLRSNPGQLLAARRKVIGPNLNVSYERPLHIVRGWQTRLYDEEGRAYLDTRNNIAHVGHEHPRLTIAGGRQMAVLNTNTRYLHRQRIMCAEKLLSTLPENLRYIYFVNSGSESNDLALRMAHAATGQHHVVVLDHAYHGNTAAVLNVSPYKFNRKGGTGCPPQTTVLPAPDMFCRQFTHGKEAANILATDVDRILDECGKSGEPIIFIHESLLGCAGQLVPPVGYLEGIYTSVRSRNGLCIADEVQTGLSRVGTHTWAFELFDIFPDIVTIGKPLGNGHPVAAVAVSEEVARAFDDGMEYFNSFGGNPVSCTIALEVMQIIEEENLAVHAATLGAQWMEALRTLQLEFPVIGDIRGHGLFFGVEFCDPGTCIPATGKAAYVVRRMLDHKILAGVGGPDENVLKIKPPMCITEDEVSFFMDVLRKILNEDRMKGLDEV